MDITAEFPNFMRLCVACYSFRIGANLKAVRWAMKQFLFTTSESKIPKYDKVKEVI
jgi:hypothetical protein